MCLYLSTSVKNKKHYHDISFILSDSIYRLCESQAVCLGRQTEAQQAGQGGLSIKIPQEKMIHVISQRIE